MRPLKVAHVGSSEVHPLHRLGGASQRRIVLASTLELLPTRRAMYGRLALKARENAMRFAWPVIVDQLDRVYREIIATPAVKAATA